MLRECCIRLAINNEFFFFFFFRYVHRRFLEGSFVAAYPWIACPALLTMTLAVTSIASKTGVGAMALQGMRALRFAVLCVGGGLTGGLTVHDVAANHAPHFARAPLTCFGHVLFGLVCLVLALDALMDVCVQTGLKQRAVKKPLSPKLAMAGSAVLAATCVPLVAVAQGARVEGQRRREGGQAATGEDDDHLALLSLLFAALACVCGMAGVHGFGLAAKLPAVAKAGYWPVKVVRFVLERGQAAVTRVVVCCVRETVRCAGLVLNVVLLLMALQLVYSRGHNTQWPRLTTACAVCSIPFFVENIVPRWRGKTAKAAEQAAVHVAAAWRILASWGASVVKACVSAGRWVDQTILRPVARAILTAVKAVWSATCRAVQACVSAGRWVDQTILRPCVRAILAAAKALWSAACRACTALGRTSHACSRAVYAAAILPCARLVARVWRIVTWAVAGVVGPVQRRLATVWTVLVSWFTRLCVYVLWPCGKVLVRSIRATARTYWKVLPACLAFHASCGFLFHFVQRGEAATLSLLLAAWALLLVGLAICTNILKTVRQREGAGAAEDWRRHVFIDTNRSLLRFVDLGALFAVRWAWRHAAKILSELVHLVSNVAGHVAKLVLLHGVRIVRIVCTGLVLPALRLLRRPVVLVWNSPWFGVLFSTATLAAAYGLHQSGFDAAQSVALGWETLGTQLAWPKGAALAVLHALWETVTWTASGAATSVGHSAHAARNVLDAPGMSDPSMALVTWLTVVALVKSQARLRVKSLAWPLMVAYGLAYLALRAATYLLVVAGWLVVQVVFINRRDARNNARADNFLQGRRARQAPAAAAPAAPAARVVSGASAPKDQFDQTECSICLDDLPEAGVDAGAHVASLPCGHRFHPPCVQQWFAVGSNHCPVCRAAAGGLERVIEIVF